MSEGGSEYWAELRHVLRRKLIALALLVGSLLSFGAIFLSWQYSFGGFLVIFSLVASISGIFRLADADAGPGQRKFKLASVRMDGESILVHSGSRLTVLPRTGVSGGWLEPQDESCAAVLRFDSGWSLAVQHKSQEEAERFLQDAGASPRQSVVRMSTYSESVGGKRTAGCLLLVFMPILVSSLLAAMILLLKDVSSGTFSMAGLFDSLLWPVVFGIPVVFMGAKLWPSWTEIGTDGVVVRRFLRRRFIPHAQIQEVLEGESHVLLALGPKQRRKLRIPVANGYEAMALRTRILMARDSRLGRIHPVGQIARGNRSMEDWKQSLAALLEQGGYRVPGCDVETLLRVVEDPGASPEHRVAAAYALNKESAAEVRSRIRVAAEACVRPNLRVILGKAAEGELGDAELTALSSKS